MNVTTSTTYLVQVPGTHPGPANYRTHTGAELTSEGAWMEESRRSIGPEFDRQLYTRAQTQPPHRRPTHLARRPAGNVRPAGRRGRWLALLRPVAKTKSRARGEGRSPPVPRKLGEGRCGQQRVVRSPAHFFPQPSTACPPAMQNSAPEKNINGKRVATERMPRTRARNQPRRGCQRRP